jgi:hypothetical protein
MRKIDNAAIYEWTSVDNPDVHRFSIIQVVNTNPSVKREGTVSGDHRFHVVDLAVGRWAAMVRMTIPTGDSGFNGSGDWRR